MLKENRDLAILMNNVTFHTRLVDKQEDIMNETSDLSIFWCVQHDTAPHCTTPHTAQHTYNTAQHSITIQFSIAQHSTATTPHRTAPQHNTALYSNYLATAQHSTAQHSRSRSRSRSTAQQPNIISLYTNQ